MGYNSYRSLFLFITWTFEARLRSQCDEMHSASPIGEESRGGFAKPVASDLQCSFALALCQGFKNGNENAFCF